jgi:branched-chain amino acid transport system permease protein
VDLTGGPLGLPGIPPPNIFGLIITSRLRFLILVSILTGTTYWISNRIVKSPFGRLLKALREDEIFVKAAGRNVSSVKIKIFIIGASLASISGVIYASYITYIDPSSFTIMESIFIISIVIIGGSANLKGSIIGSIVLVTLPELLRFIGLPYSIAANIKQMLYGALLIIFMLLRPQGLIGMYSFGKKSLTNGYKAE